MKPWKTVARRLLLDARPWLTVWAEDIHLPNGQTVDGFTTLDMPDYVVVVAQTPDGRFLTERSYKHGPRQVCLMVPGGYLDPGESPLLAAQRELLEETGYRAHRWLSLGTFVADANRGSGSGHLFLAQGLQRDQDPQSGDLEDMEITLLSRGELLEAVQSGQIPVLSNAAAIALGILQLDGAVQSPDPGR